MSGRSLERQRWVGLLALIVAAPLPFTGAATWPVVAVFAASAGWLLLARRPVEPVPVWVENVLAPAVVIAVVVLGGVRFGVMRPVAHLALLVGAIRLPGSVKRGRGGSLALLLTVVGVAAVASSTHLALVPYLVGIVALLVIAAARFDLLAFAARPEAVPWPPWRLAAATVVLAAIVAAPLFVLLPRLRSPFATAAVGGVSVSGFRGTVDLNNVGDIKTSTRVALRVDGRGVDVPPEEWLRLVGATSNRYRAGRWLESRKVGPPQDTAAAGDRASAARIEVVLEKRSDRLFVPPGTSRVTTAEGVETWSTALGDVRVPARTPAPLRYAVRFRPGRVVASPVSDADLEVPASLADLAPLARRMSAGAGSDGERAERVERALRRDFRYTTRVGGPVRTDPVRWFLFTGRRGHCEYFASSMVLLLRSIGIPARLQTGYAGGEVAADGEIVVRDSNAHAWVIARIGDGWRVFDPTPAEGRPSTAGGTGGLDLGRIWLRVQQVWDRWILTFSLRDQVEVLAVVWAWVADRWRTAVAAAALLAVLAWAVPAGLRRRRRRRPADHRNESGGTLARAIRRVIAAARKAGLDDGRAVTPRRLSERLGRERPEVASAVAWLVETHETVRYRGGPAPARADVRRALHAVMRGLRVPSSVSRPGPTERWRR